MWLIVAFTDRYEVLFFDGFTKNIKGIRMSKLKGEADKVDEVRLNYVLCFSVFYFLLCYQSEMYEDIFLVNTCIGINTMLFFIVMVMVVMFLIIRHLQSIIICLIFSSCCYTNRMT